MRSIKGLPGLLCLLLILLSCSDDMLHEPTTTYYIHPAEGDDANSGTSADTPFRTLQKVKELDLNPGDSILLAGGQIFPEPLELYGVNGSKGSAVVVSNYPQYSNPPQIRTSGAPNAVYLENCSFVEVANLKLTAGPALQQTQDSGDSMRCGVLVMHTRNEQREGIRLKNLSIAEVFFEEEGFVRPDGEVNTANGTQRYGWGIRFINTSDYGLLKNVYIGDCIIENTGHTGIKLTSRQGGKRFGIQDIEIVNNKVMRTGGPGIQMSGIKNAHIYRNSVDRSGSTDDSRKWGRGSGLWTWGSTDVLIERNSFTNANGPGDSAGAHIDFNCRNVVLQYNFSANNAGGFCEILGNNYNCAYRYNVSVNDGYRIKGQNGAFQEGKTLWLSAYAGNERIPPVNSYFYNNTIYVKSEIAAKIAISRLTKGVLIANNIFHIEGEANVAEGDQYNPETPGEWLVTDAVFRNNLFLHESSWPSELLLQDSDPFIGNANFTNPGGLELQDYIPHNTALIKDRGIVIEPIPGDSMGLLYGLQPEKDILNNTITGLPDMGAIELTEQ